jgi:RND family efflux transporter MFP subunit
MKKILSIALMAISAFAYNLSEAKLQTIDVQKSYSGDIYAKHQVMVATRLMGYIKQMNVDEGDVVHKGETLFEVDPSDIYSMINQAQAGVMQAQNGVLMAKLAYADAEKDYARFKNLYEKGAVPKRDFEKMKLNMDLRSSQIKMAEAMLAQAEAGLKQAKDQKKYAKVKAPTDGIIVRKLANVAEMAIPGHPVLVLADLKSIQARAFVKEGDVKQIKKGQEAKVYISAVNKTVKAKVSSIIPSADPATHSYLVKFTLNNKEGILPGMFAKIYVTIGKKEGVVIPYDALTSRGGVVGVFVDNNGVAKFVSTQVLYQDGEDVAVTNIKAGEKVVVLAPANMTDGTPLK